MFGLRVCHLTRLSPGPACRAAQQLRGWCLDKAGALTPRRRCLLSVSWAGVGPGKWGEPSGGAETARRSHCSQSQVLGLSGHTP